MSKSSSYLEKYGTVAGAPWQEGKAPIVRFVNKILLDAIKKGASDIHFEPYEKSFRIRTRIDGVLKEANGQSVEQLAQAENKVVLELLALRAKAGRTLP